jgi:hypothetical protein
VAVIGTLCILTDEYRRRPRRPSRPKDGLY